MELAGPVVIIEGQLYPVRAISVERDVQTDTVLSGPLKRQQGMVVTGESISGSIESYRSYELPILGAPEVTDMYLFPPDEGTRGRVVLRDVIVSGTGRGASNSTQTIEFVAKEIE